MITEQQLDELEVMTEEPLVLELIAEVRAARGPPRKHVMVKYVSHCIHDSPMVSQFGGHECSECGVQWGPE